MNLYLCTHYGFGDYITCYGLVKELASRYDNLILFAIPHRSPLHVENIKRLYRSIKNVEVTTDNPESYKDVLYVGWDKLTEAVQKDTNIQCKKFFYDQVGVPLNLLWDNFCFKRDTEKEKAVYYDKLGLKDGEEYIFLHDDPVRGFIIKQQYISRELKVIHMVDLLDISILDILYVVEKSKEVHTFNTGLTAFIDQMGIIHNNLNYHQYIRPLAFEQPILKLNWKIIN
jgi:hypothetical protein